MSLCAPHMCRCPQRLDCTAFPGAEVTSSCPSPDISSDNETWVLGKRNTYF